MGSGFRTWADGEVVTAANLNGYLQKQVVVCCTSSTRPASPEQGQLIYETDTDRIRAYDGSAWNIVWRSTYTAFTPSYTNVTVGNGTTSNCRYARIGNTIHYRGRFTLGSTSSVTGIVEVDVPITAYADSQTGAALYSDSGTLYAGACWLTSTTALRFKCWTAATPTGNANLNATQPFTWGSGDFFDWNITYEAA